MAYKLKSTMQKPFYRHIRVTKKTTAKDMERFLQDKQKHTANFRKSEIYMRLSPEDKKKMDKALNELDAKVQSRRHFDEWVRKHRKVLGITFLSASAFMGTVLTAELVLEGVMNPYPLITGVGVGISGYRDIKHY